MFLRAKYIPLHFLSRGFSRLRRLKTLFESEPEQPVEKEPEMFVVPMVEILAEGDEAQARIGGFSGNLVDQIDVASKRYIFRWKDFVIKVDPYRRGESIDKYAYQAVKEWRVYNTVKDKDKMYFAEIVGLGATTCGRYFTVQRFIPNMQSVYDWSDDNDIRTAMGDHAQMIADKYGIYDQSWGNIGVVDDEPMLYDLGVTYYLRDHDKVGDGRDCECDSCKERNSEDAEGPCDCVNCKKSYASEEAYDPRVELLIERVT